MIYKLTFSNQKKKVKKAGAERVKYSQVTGERASAGSGGGGISSCCRQGTGSAFLKKQFLLSEELSSQRKPAVSPSPTHTSRAQKVK